MKKITDKSIYKSRIVDKLVEKDLRIFGAICIEDPKWCGKTWTSFHLSNSKFFVGDPSVNFCFIILIDTFSDVKVESFKIIL